MNPVSDMNFKRNKLIERAIKENKDYIIQDLINKGYNNWDYLLGQYALKNNRVIINQLSRLANQRTMYQTVAEGAIKGNHLDLL